MSMHTLSECYTFVKLFRLLINTRHMHTWQTTARLSSLFADYSGGNAGYRPSGFRVSGLANLVPISRRESSTSGKGRANSSSDLRRIGLGRLTDGRNINPASGMHSSKNHNSSIRASMTFSRLNSLAVANVRQAVSSVISAVMVNAPPHATALHRTDRRHYHAAIATHT